MCMDQATWAEIAGAGVQLDGSNAAGRTRKSVNMSPARFRAFNGRLFVPDNKRGLNC
jgi:hypothetical protein